MNEQNIYDKLVNTLHIPMLKVKSVHNFRGLVIGGGVGLLFWIFNILCRFLGMTCTSIPSKHKHLYNICTLLDQHCTNVIQTVVFIDLYISRDRISCKVYLFLDNIYL